MKTTAKHFISFAGGAILVICGTALAQVVPAVTSGSSPFPDVQNGAFFEDSVLKLVRQGVVKGYADGRFGPNDPVTRAQVSVMIDRYDREIIQPLREQLQKIREASGLGICGDEIVHAGESCDDGNLVDGDGCSSACLTEMVIEQPSPPPRVIPPEYNGCMYNGSKYSVGQSFMAMDNCNICACQEGGRVMCTMRACLSEGTCAKENENIFSMNAGGPGRPARCCNPNSGVLLNSLLLDDGTCSPRPVGGVLGKCSSLCGNGVCDAGENICNCPAECH